jgi:hypothetical protein
MPEGVTQHQADVTARSLAIETQFEHHLRDCLEVRRETKREIKRVREGIRRLYEKLDNITEARNEQHEQNIKNLWWQRGMLIAILLAILGYLGMQTFQQVFHANQIEAHNR